MESSLDPQKRRTLLYAIPLGVFTVAGLIGVAFMPYFLARAPLVLIALSPLFRHLVLVSPNVDAFALFAVAVPRHFAPDPFVYLLGREYGPAAVDWIEQNSPSTGRLVRLLERLFAKLGPFALVVSPDLVVSTLAGVAKVRLPYFIAANIAGTILNVAVARLFGNAFDGPIKNLVAFFQANLLRVTAASVLLIMLFNALSSRKKAGQNAEGTAEPPEEPPV